MSNTPPSPPPASPPTLTTSSTPTTLPTSTTPTTATPATPPDPDAALGKEKLDLEIRQLKQATSSSRWRLEIVKAWAPPLTTLVTLGALIWTINASIAQMKQTQNGQDQDRFDKAISRLGSNSISERLTGAAGLSLFLTTDHKNRHAATLRFLGTALVIERDTNVRQAILDTFLHVNPTIVNQDSREDGLQTLLDLNRSAIKSLRQQQESDGKSKPALASDRDPQGQIDALRASAKAIVIFVKKGTSQHDFSGIDCTDCDFSSDGHPLDLSGSNFDRAVLTDANFAGVKLTGSSFDGAYLSRTNFEGANLQRTHFRGIPHDSYAVQEYKRSGNKPDPPNFACADASEADLSGSLFFGVIESADSRERIAGIPDLFQTNLTGANLSRIGVYALALKLKSKPPLNVAKIIIYQTRASTAKYGAMQVVEIPGWTFETTSSSLKQSWQFLLSQLQSARGVELATLPDALSSYKSAPPPLTGDTALHRCEKYQSSHGQ